MSSYEDKYTRGQKIGAWWLMAGCKVIGWLPYWFLYNCFAPFIYFVMYRLLGYRKGVVHENLVTTFPEKSAEEIGKIERKFYRHLSEIVVDTLDLASMRHKEVMHRLEIVNLEEHKEATKGKDWIAALGHYGSWESPQVTDRNWRCWSTQERWCASWRYPASDTASNPPKNAAARKPGSLRYTAPWPTRRFASNRSTG